LAAGIAPRVPRPRAAPNTVQDLLESAGLRTKEPKTHSSAWPKAARPGLAQAELEKSQTRDPKPCQRRRPKVGGGTAWIAAAGEVAGRNRPGIATNLFKQRSTPGGPLPDEWGGQATKTTTRPSLSRNALDTRKQSMPAKHAQRSVSTLPRPPRQLAAARRERKEAARKEVQPPFRTLRSAVWKGGRRGPWQKRGEFSEKAGLCGTLLAGRRLHAALEKNRIPSPVSCATARRTGGGNFFGKKKIQASVRIGEFRRTPPDDGGIAERFRPECVTEMAGQKDGKEKGLKDWKREKNE